MENQTTDHTGATGLAGAWLAILLSTIAGSAWLLTSTANARGYRLYHPDTIGYALLVAAAMTLPVALASTVAWWLGYRKLAERQCEVVMAGVVGALATTWLLCRLCDLMLFCGIGH
jgi:hypothetical protein